MEDDYPCRRDLVKLEDGGQISIDWFECPETEKIFNKKTPIVVFLPGLTGDRYCGYAKAIIKATTLKRFKPVVLNHRGCGGTPLITRKHLFNFLAKFYSADTIEDARTGFNHIHKKYPENPVYAIGISLGGTILGNVMNFIKIVCGG